MLHNREYFFKYVTAETALLILGSLKLKYSSPVLFNDPFDTQTRFDFDFEIDDFTHALNNEIYRLVHAEKEPIGDDTNSSFRNIKRLWNNLKKYSLKMPKELFIKNTNDNTENTIKMLNKHLEEANSWWRRLVRASRVFCLAEEYDNLLMWAHYAGEHTGAVIKFKCLPEYETSLCGARKVDYVAMPPVIASKDEYISYHTGQGPFNQKLSINNLFLSKSEHWIYEKEWRVFILPDDSDNPTIPKDECGNEILSELISFYPQEIHSIFFGCKMSEENRQEIDKLLVAGFSHVKKFRCIRNKRQYKLDFEEII